MTRVNAGQVIEEGMNGSQPGVASRHTVFADPLQMIQEAANRRRQSGLPMSGRCRFSVPAADELQKELQGVPVGQHRMAAEAALGHQVLLEEAANEDLAMFSFCHVSLSGQRWNGEVIMEPLARVSNNSAVA